MNRPSRPAAVDARLLGAIERSFARIAGADGVVDVKELKTALGLRSEYLARRVLVAFDVDRNGVITRNEFLDGVRRLVAGSDQEKLAFAFRVYDHDGDGTLSREELYRMIAMSLSESDVTERPSQSAANVAQALFEAADTNRDGRITFAELEAVVRRHPAVLRAMTRSEAQWIAPNEDLLARIEGGAPAGETAGENGWGPALAVVLLVLANGAVFATSMLRTSNDFALGSAGAALGTCIAFDAAVLLVCVMRRLLTWLRSTWVGRLVPIDHAIGLHKVVGHAVVALAIGHSAVMIATYFTGHPKGSLETFFLGTNRAWSGCALLAIACVMWLFALSFVRRSSRFELFWLTHMLWVAFFALAIVHAWHAAYWVGAPLLAFAIELVLRIGRRANETRVLEAQALRSGVTKLEVDPPRGFGWRPGDYAFLRIPEIARFEWHPFTISSAEESGALTFHIRSLGNWTSALRRRVERDEQMGGGGKPMRIFVDGPYGTPSAHIFESRFAVFIGAGIGVTPFASVLASFVYRANGENPPRLSKAHFFWLNKDQYSFEWFAELLSELEAEDSKQLLDIHLCMTAGRADTTALGVELARQVLHASGKDDIVTGLRTHTHMGQPDWERMLFLIREEHAPEPVDVYFCGPPGLARKLRPICAGLGMRFREEKF